jgi:hypothetical protein
MVRRYAAGAAVGTALAVCLTGCLGDGGGKDKAAGNDTPGAVLATPQAAQQALALIAQKSEKITTFRANMSIASSFAGRQTRMSGTAAYRLRPQLAFTMNLPGAKIGGKPTGGFREILIGDALYMNIPAMSKSMRAKPWVKFSLRQFASRSGAGSDGTMSQAQQVDPRMTVKMLTASTDARKVGTDIIGRTSVIHYTGTYSLRRALAKVDEKQRAQAEKFFSQTGLDKMSFDLWVDKSRLPRKVTMASLPGARLRMSTTVIYTAFNTPVSVTAPPASRTTDASGPGAGAPA